eukprot:1510418-Pleurochrysis_carterae.AAC.2
MTAHNKLMRTDASHACVQCHTSLPNHTHAQPCRRIAALKQATQTHSHADISREANAHATKDSVYIHRAGGRAGKRESWAAPYLVLLAALTFPRSLRCTRG